MQVLLRFLNSKSSFFTSFVSVFLGILVGAILMMLAGYDPIKAYNALFTNALFQAYDLGETIRTITPLILTGLSIALAFRTGLFNIGVEGQLIMGQLAALIVGLKLGLPPILHVTIAILAGAIAGGLWGWLPGILKASRGVHEVIVSIMMNFIALNISNLLIRTWLSVGSDTTPEIPKSASLRVDVISQWFGNSRIHLGILIALMATVFMFYLMWKTKLGYELRAVGYNSLAAEYAGMNVKRNIVLSMVFSGLLAGLAGASEVLGTSFYLSIQGNFTGFGFDGIAVSLLGANTPIGVILASILFGILTYGGGNMQFEAGVPFEVIRVIFAAIILFVAANISGHLINFFKKIVRRKHHA